MPRADSLPYRLQLVARAAISWKWPFFGAGCLGARVWDGVRTEERWRPCAPPYSFYNDLIGRYWAGGPSEASGAPIHRLCTLARKMGARSVVFEDGLDRPDVAAEVAHLNEWAQVEDGAVTAVVVSFLSSGVRRGRDYAGVPTRSVIGQATVITFPTAAGRRSYVYEAVFRLPGRGRDAEQLLNNHVPVSAPMTVVVGGVAHCVTASYFCQQNGITSICAHSAVRAIVRTLTDRPVSVPELNRLWGYDAEARSVTTLKVEEALRHFGLRTIAYNLQQRGVAPDEGWELAALLADSGSASMLVLAGTAFEHIVPVLGHTMNSDEWHPIGTTIHVEGQESVSSSSLWTDHLVLHDDVLGPYYCMSKAGLLPVREGKLKPKLVIAVLPAGVEVSPLQAESFARQILGNLLAKIARAEMGEGVWWRHLNDLRERRVFRTTMIEREAYLATLGDDAEGAWIRDRLAATLPERIWMSEVSLPNLFLANRAKLGEILLSPDAFPDGEGPDDVMRAMVAFRLPSLIGWADAGEDGSAFYSVTDWPELAHRPIYAPTHHANRW